MAIYPLHDTPSGLIQLAPGLGVDDSPEMQWHIYNLRIAPKSDSQSALTHTDAVRSIELMANWPLKRLHLKVTELDFGLLTLIGRRIPQLVKLELIGARVKAVPASSLSPELRPYPGWWPMHPWAIQAGWQPITTAFAWYQDEACSWVRATHTAAGISTSSDPHTRALCATLLRAFEPLSSLEDVSLKFDLDVLAGDSGWRAPSNERALEAVGALAIACPTLKKARTGTGGRKRIYTITQFKAADGKAYAHVALGDGAVWWPWPAVQQPNFWQPPQAPHSWYNHRPTPITTPDHLSWPSEWLQSPTAGSTASDDESTFSPGANAFSSAQTGWYPTAQGTWAPRWFG